MNQLTMFETDSIKAVNVSKIPQRSPFRYPGGKTWLVPWIRLWFSNMTSKPTEFIEPFAGGAIVGLTAAFENLAERVTLVEIDDQVAAVWKTILSDDVKWLCDKIYSFNLTLDNAKREIEKCPGTVREKAFITILKNRIYHGGIIANGSGMIKNGENGKGIKSRWYPQTLINRMTAIYDHRERINFIEGDGIQYLNQLSLVDNAAVFIDPPYTAGGKNAGKRLYKYSEIDHIKLFNIAGELACPFLMTYDNSQEIYELSDKSGFRKSLVPMKNTHHNTMFELLISRDLNWLNKF